MAGHKMEPSNTTIVTFELKGVCISRTANEQA
jgi:hypothetical protein